MGNTKGIVKVKKLIRFACSVVLIFVSLFWIQRLLLPKYVSNTMEGGLIAEYYGEEKDHDVIFIGDCEVYENFSPKVLWEHYGINSYIRGSGQQLIWQSYYLLEDTLRYEKPEVMIFNVLSMKYDEPQKEAYNRMTLEGMEWSRFKVRSIQASMTEDEKFLDYVFPLLRYHSRWKELGIEDIQYLSCTKKISHNGYYMRVDVKPAQNMPEGNILQDYRFGENAYFYLNKMTKLCEEKDIQLILIKAPSLYPYWYGQWEEQIESYARENHLLYINFLELTEETGLDYDTDTYDGGLHMNLSGAEKITQYLGKVLVQETGIQDRRGEKELSLIWNEKCARYERDKEEQYRKLEREITK